MKTAELRMENGDFKVYCFINNILDKIAVLPTLNSAEDYLSTYIKN